MRLLALGLGLMLLLGLGTSLELAGSASAASTASSTPSASDSPSDSPGDSPSGSSGSSSRLSSLLPSLLPSTSPKPSKSSAKPSKSPSASTSPSKSPSKSPTASPTSSPAKSKDSTGTFHPTGGAKFNDPLNRAPYHNDTIRKDAIRAIASAPRGSSIKIAMFNFKSVNYLQALIKAHQRGVQVQFLMCACNDTKALGNPQPNQLRTELKKGNAGLPASQQSWVRECRGSCRGAGGINHFKFIAFSAVGAGKRPVPDVVMYGSNNATEVAVNRQWNDWYTYVRDQRLYDDFVTVFDQAAKDQPVGGGAYVQYNFMNARPKSSIWFYPYTGKKATGDPVLKKLAKIGCTGATQKFLHGHTRVRIAQDAIAGARGIAIARKLASLRTAGCDVRIVYTLMGGQVKTILQNAGIHLVHYAYDRNDDGEYDMYLHGKDMAVEGVYDGDKGAYVTWNGTANWTPLPLHSDEIVSEIHDRKVTISYTQWINWLLASRPSWWPTTSSTDSSPDDVTGRRTPDGIMTPEPKPRVDPYAQIRGDL